ncbi:unnamed protein product, partial [Effrenium voratum]
MKAGLDEAAAEAAALAAAKVFRAKLVAKSHVKERAMDESLTSDVPGVKFEKARKKWRVVIPKPGGGRIQGGYFTEKVEAEARALQLREVHGLQVSVKRTASRAERAAAAAQLPVFQPKVPFPGVFWAKKDQAWMGHVDGKIRRIFRPLDHSEAELEKAFAKAKAWQKKTRKEIEGQKVIKKVKKAKSMKKCKKLSLA